MRGYRPFFLFALSLGACTGNVVPQGTTTGNALHANVTLGLTGRRVLMSPELEEDPAGTRITLCLQGIRFVSESGTEVALDYPFGEVALSRENFELGDYSVPPGHYRAVVLRLGQGCDSSVVIRGPRGEFESDSPLEITFPVNVRVRPVANRVWLPTFPLLLEGSRVSHADQIPSAIHGAKERLESLLEEEVLQAGFAARRASSLPSLSGKARGK